MARKKQNTAAPHKEAELAEHVAAILAHPYTPSMLYNAVAGAMCDLQNYIPAKESCDTAGYIERVLNWHQGMGFRNIGLKDS